MSDKNEECELTLSNEGRLKLKALEHSPPVTPNVYKLAVTPSSPTSNKVSSNGGSLLGEGISQGSLSSRSKLLEPSITPVDTPIGNSKFLYVREKLRRPSLFSDSGCRTPKDGKSANPRMGNLKKAKARKRLKKATNSPFRTLRIVHKNFLKGDPNHGPVLVGKNNLFRPRIEQLPNVLGNIDQFPPSVPPNTPSPSGWRNFSSADFSESRSEDIQNDSSFLGSDISSQVTTKALASESENTSKAKTSTETLSKAEKTPRPIIPVDCNFGSNNHLNWSEHLNYLKATRSGHTGLRSVGSSAFIKSFWGNKSQKNVQHHCFMSDITDVRQMEQALLQLLEDFHSGKLRAFAKDCSMEQMQGIREQQERLARLHFDLGAQQDLFAPLSEEGLSANQENMQKLMGSLEQLSLSIEKLQLFSKDVNQ